MRKSHIKKIAVFFVSLSAICFIAFNKAYLEPTRNEIAMLQTQVAMLEAENTELKSILKEWNVGYFTATFYAPYDNKSGTCNDGNPNSTATGTLPSRGTIAVNPLVVPYHSEMVIVGNGWVEYGKALDTGAAMRRNANRIDIYVDTYEEAISRGVQKVIVFWRSPNGNKCDIQR